LNQLFTERWQLMLDAITQIDAEALPAREKLYMVASFIIDSYRHEPQLMKVIIVEVTRAANSFGQTHLEQIRQAYLSIAAIVTKAQQEGVFKSEIDAEFAAMTFYGAIEQVLTGWIFGLLPADDEHFERAKGLVVEMVCGGLDCPPGA
ncbi:MAG TPA: TetR/AcrR family transcriptional regulator C-terminal domain-containing protein, partial [Solirubrobacteraceae bacterium]|nr:TetR/AcrR family transcriptional regulator C-terminal domain-containing protein [Solirubrobacteraceae bacterium]